MKPATCIVSGSWFRSEEGAVFAINGCLVHYLALPDKKTFLGAHDWTDETRIKRSIRDTIEK